MNLVIYFTLLLVLITVKIGFLLLGEVGRPNAFPEDLSTRIAVLEQIANTLPGIFREESRIGREESRAMFGSQTEAIESRFSAVETRFTEFGKVQTDQLTAMRSEAPDGRAKLEDAVRMNAEGFAASQSDRLKETNEAVRSMSDRLLAG